MTSAMTINEILDRLAHDLRETDSCSEALLRRVAKEACTRLPALRAASHLDRLIAAGALTEAALAIVRLEMPSWSLRRLSLDDGIWFCSLSQTPALPAELDASADGFHYDLAMAILCAFVEARRLTLANSANPQPRIPQTFQNAAIQNAAMCCDNFR